MQRAKCPRCGFVVVATTTATSIEAQHAHTRAAHPDAPELHLPVPYRHPNDPGQDGLGGDQNSRRGAELTVLAPSLTRGRNIKM